MVILLSNFDFYQKDIAQFKLIKSNIKDLIKQDEFYKSSLYGIKGIEINHNKIYISLTYEKKKIVLIPLFFMQI